MALTIRKWFLVSIVILSSSVHSAGTFAHEKPFSDRNTHFCILSSTNILFFLVFPSALRSNEALVFTLFRRIIILLETADVKITHSGHQFVCFEKEKRDLLSVPCLAMMRWRNVALP